MEENLVSASQSAEKMTVSVIIPVYNVAPYLDACLESVCSQTYDKLEIILVDDGSKDESSRLCDNWRERDPRIRVIHQENAGVSCARNKGLDVCTGELICFVDSDDWLDLRMIEKLVRCLQENDADAAMCGFVDYPHGAPVEKGLFPVPPCDFTGTVYQMIRRNGYFTALWAKLFCRSLVFRSDNYVRFDTSLSWRGRGVAFGGFAKLPVSCVPAGSLVFLAAARGQRHALRNAHSKADEHLQSERTIPAAHTERQRRSNACKRADL